MAWLLLAAASLPLALIAFGETAPDTKATAQAGTATADDKELLAWGRELYALNCAVCHGRGGGGLAEAKLAFPEDHRNCTRCHRPGNRIVQPLNQPFEDNNMFAIGDPPALHGSAAGDRLGLTAVAEPAVILAYVAATMPRYDPGRLTFDQYVAITAHLLELNGRTDDVGNLPSVHEPGE